MSLDPEFSANLRSGRGGRYRTPTVLQMETTECAAACLGMILAYHGRWEPLEELRERCGVSRDGASGAAMLRTAREYGLSARGFRCRRERLFDLPFPMILFWRFNHFVVLEGIKGRHYYVNDPDGGPRRLTEEEFAESYSGVCFSFAKGDGFRPGGTKPGGFRGLLDRLGHARGALAFVALATGATFIPGVAVPTMIKVFVDDVLIRRTGDWLNALLIGLALSAFVSGFLVWLQQVFLARMEVKLSVVTAAGFLWYLVSLPISFFSQRHAGDLAGRVALNDSVARLLSGELAVNTINALMIGFYAAVMLTYDVLLTLAAVAIAAVNVLVLGLASRYREDKSRRLLREEGKVAGVSANGIMMVDTLKANGAEGSFFGRWMGVYTNAIAARQQLGFVTTLMNAAPPLLNTLTAVVLLGLGGLRILDGSLTIGGLVAFWLLAQNFAVPLAGLVGFGAGLQIVRAEIARLDDVLNYKPDERAVRALRDVETDTASPPPAGHLVLDRVTFGYNRTDPPLFEDFSLSIRPGRRVALVGGSGSGKTTIAKIACGLLTPWSGKVYVDGDDLAAVSAQRLSEIVSHVDQEFVLFEGSVKENVALWDSTVADRDVVRALRDAAMQDEIAARPGKYDAFVCEDGRNFSGGQRQRLEIARSLACNPAVLVLDEATSALDPVTEIEIENRLRQRGCTCLIIAHRLSTIRDADEILVLDRGRIVQRGAHDALIAEEGPYRTLVGTGGRP